MNRKNKLKIKKRVLQAESLEHRQLMAFGVAWPNARNLSISFPSDGVAVGGWENNLRSTLDQVADRRVWQTEVARAFQTWAVETNLNIGVRTDRDDGFGTIGLPSEDPRFGEFRIGAFPQSDTVLANAVPYTAAAGTWSGDLLLNSNVDYVLGDWSSGTPSNVEGTELFSVLLHEAGNALGLADNNLPQSVMYQTYNGPKGQLSAADKTAIRALYGTRRDIYEPVRNETIARARVLPVSTSPTNVPYRVRGSINRLNDVDVYRFTPRAGQTEVSVRLQASGMSFLKSKIEILGPTGVKINDAKVDSIFENNMSIRVSSLDSMAFFYVRVSSNSDDVFGMGDYQLVFDYRPESQQPPLAPAPFDPEDDNSVPWRNVDIDALFASAGNIDREVGQNETLATARPMSQPPGFVDRTRYDALSTLSSTTDVDFWSFRAPSVVDGMLHIGVKSLGSDVNRPLRATIVNRDGVNVASRTILGADGAISIEVNNPVANAEYFVSIQFEPGGGLTALNYLVSVNFATQAANPVNLFSGQTTGNNQRDHYLTINKTQLYRFDMLATADTDNGGMQMTIVDLRTGQAVFVLGAPNRIRRGDHVWLEKGNYLIRMTPRSRTATPPAFVNYSLRIAELSDDQGPRPLIPTAPPASYTTPVTPPVSPPIRIVIPIVSPWGIVYV